MKTIRPKANFASANLSLTTQQPVNLVWRKRHSRRICAGTVWLAKGLRRGDCRGTEALPFRFQEKKKMEG
jgi:hypothetical protein